MDSLHESQKEENEMIVFGYIHSNTKDIDLFMSIPVAIIQVIFKFYHCTLLIWDWSVVQNVSIQPVPNTINAIKQTGIGYESIIAQNAVSSELYKRCYYEILIENASGQTGGRKNIDLFIGYVTYLEDKTQHVLNEHIGSATNNQDQYSIYLYPGWRFFAVYNKGKQKETLQIFEMMQTRWKVGDKIGIEIDFEEDNAKAYYNGKYVGIMFHHVPKTVVPAISLFWTNLTISCPIFQLFEK